MQSREIEQKAVVFTVKNTVKFEAQFEATPDQCDKKQKNETEPEQNNTKIMRTYTMSFYPRRGMLIVL